MAFTLTVGGLAHGDGTPFAVRNITSNLWSAPDIRADDVGKAGVNGVFAGRDLLAARRVTVLVAITEATMAAALGRLRELAAAWNRTEGDVALSWTDDSGSWRLNGRPRLAEPNVENVAVGFVEAECRFVATDPLIYSATEHAASTTLPSAAGGRTYPRTYPYNYGAGPTGGSLSASNLGTVEAPWTATITGPITNPKLTLVDTGEFIGFNIVLAAGEFLDIDSHAPQSVLLAGTASRYSALMAGYSWFGLASGGNTVAFSASAGSGLVELRWRDAWI